MQLPKAFFFDVFGTLVDWRTSIAREAAAILKPLGITPTIVIPTVVGYTSGAFVTRWDADPVHGARAARVDRTTIVVHRPKGGAKADAVPAALRAHLDGRRG